MKTDVKEDKETKDNQSVTSPLYVILEVMNHITNSDDKLDIHFKKMPGKWLKKSSLLAKLKAKVMGFTITN
jgi:hypothetical protein